MTFDQFENKHYGERCFILGNGPSLLNENLSLLKNEKIFICNKGYKALDIGLISHYDYFVLTDVRVYKQDYEEIQTKVSSPRFYSSLISEQNEYVNGPKEDYVSILRFDKKDKRDKRKMGIIRNIMPTKFSDGWGKTRTVVFDAALVAFFMGFKEIYLLGTDLSFDNITNTHFYGTGVRETKLINEFSNKTATWPIIVKNLNNLFESKNVNFVNLSKGYKLDYGLKTDTLENVISYKPRT